MLVMLCYPAHQLAFVTHLAAMFNLQWQKLNIHVAINSAIKLYVTKYNSYAREYATPDAVYYSGIPSELS